MIDAITVDLDIWDRDSPGYLAELIRDLCGSHERIFVTVDGQRFMFEVRVRRTANGTSLALFDSENRHRGTWGSPEAMLRANAALFPAIEAA